LGVCWTCGDSFFLFVLILSQPSGVYPLSLHDALPISGREGGEQVPLVLVVVGTGQRVPGTVLVALGIQAGAQLPLAVQRVAPLQDRKSTRLNSSHVKISYAVFCLKKKKCENFCIVAPS